MGQRCVGVCGRCQFAATSPVLSAALFASKGSNMCPYTRDTNIHHPLVLFHLFRELRGVQTKESSIVIIIVH